jgi:flagellar FliJ protein
MAGFRFSLEQVLRYRKQLEEEAMQELARARARLEECEAFIRRCEAEIMAQRETMSRPDNLASEARWLVSGYLAGLTRDLDLARERRILCEEEVDRCRAKLVQRAQDTSLLEKLKARQAARFAHAEQLQEQKTYDEIATLRFVPASR